MTKYSAFSIYEHIHLSHYISVYCFNWSESHLVGLKRFAWLANWFYCGAWWPFLIQVTNFSLTYNVSECYRCPEYILVTMSHYAVPPWSPILSATTASLRITFIGASYRTSIFSIPINFTISTDLWPSSSLPPLRMFLQSLMITLNPFFKAHDMEIKMSASL